MGLVVNKTSFLEKDSTISFERTFFVNTATSFLYYAKAADRDTEWERIITAPNAGVPEYSSNAAAIFAGAQIGSLYRTGDFLKIVH